MRPTHRPWCLAVFLGCVSGVWFSTSTAGALDEPDPAAIVDKSNQGGDSGQGGLNQDSQEVPQPAPQAAPAETLIERVRREQDQLEQLPQAELERRAQRGERTAQVVLGTTFAREASLLGFSNAAASDAMADALRWYSRAAAQGFPGAPSLDRSGIRLYPVRAPR